VLLLCIGLSERRALAAVGAVAGGELFRLLIFDRTGRVELSPSGICPASRTARSLRLRGGGEDDAPLPATAVELCKLAEEKFAAVVSKGGASFKGDQGSGGVWSCLTWLAKAVAGSQDDGASRDEQLEEAADIFGRAANKFKLQKNWLKVRRCQCTRVAAPWHPRPQPCWPSLSHYSCSSSNTHA